jgi:hypothetical protein
MPAVLVVGRVRDCAGGAASLCRGRGPRRAACPSPGCPGRGGVPGPTRLAHSHAAGRARLGALHHGVRWRGGRARPGHRGRAGLASPMAAGGRGHRTRRVGHPPDVDPHELVRAHGVLVVAARRPHVPGEGRERPGPSRRRAPPRGGWPRGRVHAESGGGRHSTRARNPQLRGVPARRVQPGSADRRPGRSRAGWGVAPTSRCWTPRLWIPARSSGPRPFPSVLRRSNALLLSTAMASSCAPRGTAAGWGSYRRMSITGCR